MDMKKKQNEIKKTHKKNKTRKLIPRNKQGQDKNQT